MLWVSPICFGAAAIVVVGVVFDLDQPDKAHPGRGSCSSNWPSCATDVTFDKIGRICDMHRFGGLRLMRLLRLAFKDIRDVRVGRRQATHEPPGAPAC